MADLNISSFSCTATHTRTHTHMTCEYMKGLSLCSEVRIRQWYQQRAVTGSALFPQCLDTSSHSCKLANTRVHRRNWGTCLSTWLSHIYFVKTELNRRGCKILVKWKSFRFILWEIALIPAMIMLPVILCRSQKAQTGITHMDSKMLHVGAALLQELTACTMRCAIL